jgi:thioredoxin-like negative regulator of GroEL
LELAGQATEVRTEALFDLAVGSLFHESMILRENLYQQEKYGPRVDALRSDANPSARELSLEFDKILNSSASRLREAVEEVDVLLALTSDQLVRLLVEECDNELLARCLYEEKAAVAAVFPRGLKAMLAEVHGSATEGLMKAADSYIESAYYDQALEVLSQVTDGQGKTDSWAFASAMHAFLERDYPRCVEHLSVWLGKDRRRENPSRLKLVIAAARYVEREHEGQFTPKVRAQLLTLEAQLKVGVEV